MNDAAKGGWWRWSLGLPVLVLVSAVAIQGAHFFHENPKPRGPHLNRYIPETLPGWSSRDVPLGANEFIVDEVEKVLNYDEVVCREYNRGAESFNVYVAYWGAGKMPTRLVASHTPDRCWTENGWHCLEMKFKQHEFFDGMPLQPAEWRMFEPPLGGKPVYVLYWQLVDGHAYDYGDRFNDVPSPFLWWKDAVQQALFGSREQYFIRLTSTEPLESLWNDPGFAEVLRGLGQLGLVAKHTVTAGN
ncbi:MAG TPA: hypothetical protein VMI53_12740 [Opitutaceae bacterium]|nr:hypothetical protein [Opitutaceae bacterium]